MTCKVCGADATCYHLCSPCDDTWVQSPEFARYEATPRGQDDEVFETSMADFVRRVRAERENGGRPGAHEVTT